MPESRIKECITAIKTDLLWWMSHVSFSLTNLWGAYIGIYIDIIHSIIMSILYTVLMLTNIYKAIATRLGTPVIICFCFWIMTIRTMYNVGSSMTLFFFLFFHYFSLILHPNISSPALNIFDILTPKAFAYLNPFTTNSSQSFFITLNSFPKEINNLLDSQMHFLPSVSVHL